MKTLPNLLIVDDTKGNLVLLESFLRKVKVNLIEALSGSEALKKIRGIELALAIIDVRMPGMDGYELALKINEEKSGEKVPIIFITADHINERHVFKGYDSGAVDYIFKPVDDQILLSKINVFLDLFNQKQKIKNDAELLKNSTDELNKVLANLKKSEEKYRNYIDSAPDGIFIADETGRYIEVNNAACMITGYSKDELLKMSVSDLYQEKSLKDDDMTPFGKVVKTGTSKADMPFRHKNGTIRWWSVEAVKLSKTRFLGFAKDITQRSEMEESLRTHQFELEMQNDELMLAIDKARIASQKYTELYDFAPSGYFTLSAEGIIQEINHSGALMLGKERSRLTDNHFGFFVSRNSLPAFNAFLKNVFTGKGKEICEVMLETEGNQPKYVHIEGMVLVNRKECHINVVDITERKMAEQAVIISEEKYRTMLNSSPDGILLINMKGIITEVSDIGLELFGADNIDDLVGKNVLQFVAPDEKINIKEILEKTLNEGLVQNFELKIKKKNKTLVAGEISVTLIQRQDGTPLSYMVITRDITQRKKEETKQMHADRMINLGEMASGIAHEINQPLNIISLVMDKILFESAKTKTIDIGLLKDKSDKIFENITRIRNIIDHIRAFSRSQDDYILTSFNINSSIENAASMVIEQFKHLGIELNLQLGDQIPQIFGNTYKFEQVIINMLINAKDAVIEKKSKLSEYTEMIIGIRSYLENQLIIVEITDNGIGISDDDINNVMLPFYTTKDEGKGTGLGLSICYQIIKEMDGTIDIKSKSLSGTKIKIVLDIQKKK
jgi:PAS domain S-box-containing protein